MEGISETVCGETNKTPIEIKVLSLAKKLGALLETLDSCLNSSVSFSFKRVLLAFQQDVRFEALFNLLLPIERWYRSSRNIMKLFGKKVSCEFLEWEIENITELLLLMNSFVRDFRELGKQQSSGMESAKDDLRTLHDKYDYFLTNYENFLKEAYGVLNQPQIRGEVTFVRLG